VYTPTSSQQVATVRIALLSIKKAIRVNDEQYWLYVVVDPDTNRILNSWFDLTYSIRSCGDIVRYRGKYPEKHDVFEVLRKRP
jgi:hypothetical protein